MIMDKSVVFVNHISYSPHSERARLDVVMGYLLTARAYLLAMVYIFAQLPDISFSLWEKVCT
jgi:hypothetical protein